MAKFERPDPNEWVQPILNGYKMSCCDCGLVHNVDFRIYEGRVQFRTRRNRRSTAIRRRHKYKGAPSAEQRVTELEAALEGMMEYAASLLEKMHRTEPPRSEV